MNQLKSRTLPSIFITILLTLNGFISFGQDSLQYIALTNGAQKEIDQENFKAIDSYFDDVKIAGLGESTHGTSEFHTFRAKLFKYLVRNKGFNTLFLEADYADCIAISDYVAGEEVNIREAMKALYWPWQTEELLSLIEWMRVYNKGKEKSSQLQFIGIDGQWSDDAEKELNKLLLANDKKALDSTEYPLISMHELSDLRKRAAKKRLEYIRGLKKNDISSFSEADQQKFHLLIQNIEQALAGLIIKCGTYRDTMMGQNMLERIKLQPETKAIFWAHNWHVFNVLDHYDRRRNEQHGFAGGILKKELADQYVAIIQDFDYGSFIAYHRINDSKKMKLENYKLGAVEIEQSVSGTYGERLRGIKEETIFIDLDKNDPKIGTYKSHTIDAVFSPEKNNKKQTAQFNYCPARCYDAVVFTKKSTPIQLINE